MEEICLGAFATEPEAEQEMLLRPELAGQMFILEDGDIEHPWRVWWRRP